MANNDIDAAPIGAHEPAPVDTMVQHNLSSQENNGVVANAVASQPPLPTATTSDNSQLTVDGQEPVFTPPASDMHSSQSTIHDEGPLSQLSQLSQLAAAQTPLKSNPSTTPPKTSNITLNASQKRTADGNVKSKVSNSPSPEEQPPFRRHARNTSTVSTASSVASRFGEVSIIPAAKKRIQTKSTQLSSDLRTRLSYAMVKVNNGWESKSINEVETIASQVGSPTSSNSTLTARRISLSSPRAAIATIQSQGSRDVFGPRPTADFDLYSGSEPPPGTYDAFWHNHSTTNGAHSHRHNLYNPVPPQSKSLAPPADIRPTATSRRSDPKFSKPPSMPGQSSASPYHSYNGHSAPRTPNSSGYHRPELLINSGQKTLQEQDAIATLLLMGSPGHSQTLGSTLAPPQGSQLSPQISPLRAEFSLRKAQKGKSKLGSQPQRRVEFAESISSGSDNGYTAASHKTSALRNSLSRRRVTDRMLDEMEDESSDEEVEIPLPRGRRITGRV